MEKENKYYIPLTDEFHENFEFEYNEYDENKDEYTDNWIKTKFDIRSGLGHDLNHQLHENQIRVKYLDKSDLESLGFKLISEEKKQYSHWCKFKKDKIELHVQLNEKYFPRLLNMNGDYIGNLRIKIKNKSELKKLMKQLNII